MNQMAVIDIPVGATVWIKDTWYRVEDIRRHALTEDDGTVWVILEGHDPLKMPLHYVTMVNTTFT